MLFQSCFTPCTCQAPHLGGSTLSPRLKCIHVADCIAHSMLCYEGISSPLPTTSVCNDFLSVVKSHFLTADKNKALDFVLRMGDEHVCLFQHFHSLPSRLLWRWECSPSPSTPHSPHSCIPEIKHTSHQVKLNWFRTRSYCFAWFLKGSPSVATAYSTTWTPTG